MTKFVFVLWLVLKNLLKYCKIFEFKPGNHILFFGSLSFAEWELSSRCINQKAAVALHALSVTHGPRTSKWVYATDRGRIAAINRGSTDLTITFLAGQLWVFLNCVDSIQPWAHGLKQRLKSSHQCHNCGCLMPSTHCTWVGWGNDWWILFLSIFKLNSQ